MSIGLLTILFSYEFNTFIQTDSIIVQNLSERYAQDIIANYLNLRHQWIWASYIFIPVALYLSTTLIASIILLVIELYYLNEMRPKIKFKDTWGIVLMAQWSTLGSIFVKVLWFGFYHTKFTMNELQSFSPLSLINLFDRKTLDVWLIYPIQLFNVFEFMYWAILVIGIKKILQKTWLKSLEIIFLSYGVALFIWVVVIMFVSLNFSLK
ncbi:MAG: hypothetical protein JZU53_00360 [Paludibacter sp.]|nr:hypothetical protein [Paludibacter sp.]